MSSTVRRNIARCCPSHKYCTMSPSSGILQNVNSSGAPGDCPMSSISGILHNVALLSNIAQCRPRFSGILHNVARLSNIAQCRPRFSGILHNVARLRNIAQCHSSQKRGKMSLFLSPPDCPMSPVSGILQNVTLLEQGLHNVILLQHCAMSLFSVIA